ncbi:Severe Depolymerization of Actin [Coemansia sp. RSA 2336]|nr:Severe Depolymerization of Actin [Coemansia sp. RSA 2336]
MGRKLRSSNLLSNLPQLQNLIKRDPQSYEEEFSQQLHHFEASLAIFELKPDEEAKEFGDLINFLSQVARCYPEKSAQFPTQLIELLQKHYPVLNADLRRSIVQALVLLRNRGVVTNTRVMPLFFTLFRCHDKKLRSLLYSHIVNDVKVANKGKHRDHKLNKTLQSFMYTMITAADAQDKHGEGAIAAKKSLDVCIELYRKNIWTDAKAVNVIVQACFSPINKIMLTAVQFFLNPTKKADTDDADDEDEDEAKSGGAGKTKKHNVNFMMIQHQSNVNKKTKHRVRVLEKATRIRKREQARRDGQLPDDDDDEVVAGSKKKTGPAVSFDALSLVHDPQGFAEKLFARVHRSATATKRGGNTADRFEVRLILLKLISRLIGHHQLQLMAFYPFLQRYLQPHQMEVTQILALLANASHAFTPPDVLQPLIRAIADNFVSDHCAPEVMCAGLNTVRAIAARQPLAVDPDLLNDLVMYRKHKDKGVMMAARSLLLLYRQTNPEMLHRRDRGREATMNLSAGGSGKAPLGFGEIRPAEGVAGAELLELPSDSDSQLEYVSADEEQASGEELDSDEEQVSGEELDSGKERASGEELDSVDEEQGSDEESLASGTECLDAASSDESEEEEPTAQTAVAGAKKRVDMMRILTNEDFARIERLKRRQRHEGQQQHSSKKARAEDGYSDYDESEASGSDSQSEDTGGMVDGWDILGDYHSRRRRRKATYDERMESIRSGREGREKFSSSKAKREKEGRSLSNKEKRKTKNFKMIAHKRSVVSKGKRSLAQKRRELRNHITYGLRGEDYTRYRRYCAHHLHTVRKAANLQQGTSAKFCKQEVTSENAASPAHVEIQLLLAERAWAYAMDLRELYSRTEEPRQRQHLVHRLKAATKAAHHLAELAPQLCEPRTVLAAYAYWLQMQSQLCFEKQEWEAALNNAVMCRRIIDALAQTGSSQQYALSHAILERLDPIVRLSAYQIRMPGAQQAQPAEIAAQVSADRLQATIPNYSKVEAALGSVSSAASSSVSFANEMHWRGGTVTFASQDLSVLVETAQNKLKAALSDDNGSFDAAAYAFRKVSKMARRCHTESADAASKTHSVASDALVSAYLAVQLYATCALSTIAVSKFTSKAKGFAAASGALPGSANPFPFVEQSWVVDKSHSAEGSQLTQAVIYYDKARKQLATLQKSIAKAHLPAAVAREIKQQHIVDEVAAAASYYTCLRNYYSALQHASPAHGKYKDALALLDTAVTKDAADVTAAIADLTKRKHISTSSSAVDELWSQTLAVSSDSVSAVVSASEEAALTVRGLCASSTKHKEAWVHNPGRQPSMAKNPLAKTSSMTPSLPARVPRLVDLEVRFEAVPVKPLFYDLAAPAIDFDMETISANTADKQASSKLGAIIGSLWGSR